MIKKVKLTEFERMVLEVIKKIPPGRVATYEAVAKAISKPRAARAVGNALHKNPYSPQVPCHRVVRNNGQLGGFASGPGKKIELLKKEGVDVKNGRVDNFNEILYSF
jgi:methylated-DNA-[protein]-cysteine S-methyltransferase